MPYPAQHKERTRARIVNAARELFNRHGFEQVSIDQIMEHAGLTRGGFYYHFSSKSALYAEAVASFSAANPFRRRVAALPVRPDARTLARMLIDAYLSDAVFGNIDLHCPLYALPSDVVRAGQPPQEAYTQLVRGLLAVFGAALEGRADANQRAESMVALCVGGMLLARTTNDESLRNSLRASSRQQALALLD